MADPPNPSGTATGWLSQRLGAFLQGPQSYATPDVTKIQALAIGQAAVAVLVVLGIDLDESVKQTIIALAAVLGAVLPLSDAAVRRGRAKHADAIAEAQRAARTTPAGGRPVAAAELLALFEADLDLANARALATPRAQQAQEGAGDTKP